MNYVDHICTTEFTVQQGVRMRAMWDIYRAPSRMSVNPPIEIMPIMPLSGQSLASGTWQTYTVQNIPFLDVVSVELSGNNGDADLFMDLCSSISESSSIESCTASGTQSSGEAVQFEVYASEGFTGLTVTVISNTRFRTLDAEESSFIGIGLSLPTGSSELFLMRDVPADATVTVTTSGENGDADLYLYTNLNFPSRCSSTSVFSNEECVFEASASTDLYILLYAVEQFGGLTVVVDVELVNSCNFFFAILAFFVKILTFGLIKLCG